MLLYSFRISIGNNKSSLIPNDAFKEFYQHVAKSILQTDIITSEFSQINIPVKPPLNTDWKVFSDIAGECLMKIQKSDANTCILLHIHETIKPTNYYEAFAIFETLKNTLAVNTKTIFFLNDVEYILSIIPSISDKIGIDKELIFVNRNGEYTYSNETKKNIENFSELFNSIQLSIQDKLKLKLIRKLGHFVKEKDGKHISCQKYFYDGSYCITEITSLLYEQIISKIDTTKSFGIYECYPYTNWAKNSFLQIHEELKRNYKGKYLGQIIADEFEEVEQIILLTDVIVSGITVREKYNSIFSKNNNVTILSFCIIDCISDKQTEEIGGDILLENGISNIKINFLFQRNQKYDIAETKKCDMCKSSLDVPKKKFDDLGIDPALSSFEMWSMTIESGLHPEHTPPTDEQEIERFPHNIPNTLNIVKLNGAYLATKFNELLRQNSLQFPPSGFIAYPDETNNTFNHYQNLTSDRVPSNLFISSLKLIYGYNILPIPRNIIEEIKKDPSNLDFVKIKHADFYHNQLLRVKNEPIIIVDEFPNSYKTYDGIRKILRIIDKTPLAFITLFNFSPDLVKEKITDTKHFNFYEFQLD